jgi:hypothetical protein
MGDIKVNPENWDRLVEKYYKSVEKDLQETMESSGASSYEEMLEIKKKAINEQQRRREPDHKDLKDRTVLIDAKSKEVNAVKQDLMETLAKEKAVAEASIHGITAEEKAGAPSLKHRVQPGVPHSKE